MSRAALAIAAALAISLLFAPGRVSAHKPSFAPEGYASAETAFPVVDPGVSIVVYREVTCEFPTFWLSFDAAPAESLFLQMLVPEIEGLRDYRPSLALIGPGLPDADLPFGVPAGLGALVFDTDAVTNPPVFDEPFTQTRSWILVEQTVPAVDAGTHYVVAFDPEGLTGKLSVAIGTREEFGIQDIGMLPEWTQKVRAFHETPDYPPAEPATVGECAAAEEAMTDPVETPATDDAPPAPVDGEAATGEAFPGGPSGVDEPPGSSGPAMGIAGGAAQEAGPGTASAAEKSSGCQVAAATPMTSATWLLVWAWLARRAWRPRSLRVRAAR